MQKIVEIIEKDLQLNLTPCFITESEQDLIPLLVQLQKRYQIEIIRETIPLSTREIIKDKNGNLVITTEPCQKIATVLNFARCNPDKDYLLFFINTNRNRQHKNNVALRMATDKKIGTHNFPSNVKTAISLLRSEPKPDSAEISRTTLIPRQMLTI